MRFLLDMRWSLVAFAATLALGLVSMGALGAALYHACYPLFAPFYGSLNDWHGDWVWPATIVAGMLWSVGFLAAGAIGLFLKRRGAAAVPRRIAYVAVLWLAAALIWAVVLLSAWIPPKEAATTEAIGCGEGNRAYIEAGLSGALGSGARLVGGPRCITSPFVSDMVSAAELAPDFKPEGLEFSPGSAATEAPLDMLETMYPETFSGLAGSEFEVANIQTTGNVAVHLVRLGNGRLYVLMNDLT